MNIYVYTDSVAGGSFRLFDQKAVSGFIEMTHEKYKKFLCDEFGKGRYQNSCS